MTKKELEKHVDRVISAAKKGNKRERKSVEEALYDVYKTLAEHYNNRIPKSVHDIFTSRVTTFQSYLDEKAKEQSIQKEDKSKKLKKLNEEIIELQMAINEAKTEISNLESGTIYVYDDTPKKTTSRSNGYGLRERIKVETPITYSVDRNEDPCCNFYGRRAGC